MNSDHNTAADIMVVDDAPANLKLLDGMLRERGHRVRVFPRGRLALAAAEQQPPDLILLDVNMPEMNGYEVCQQLKSSRKLREIPVLFISALSESMDKVKAFTAGAVDYVTKPFQFEEVEARVRTHLALRRHERRLQENYDRLRKLEDLRESLTQMMVHDMRSPLAAILMALEIEEQRLGPDSSNADSFLRLARESAELLKGMVTQLLDISRLETGAMPIHPTACDLAQLTQTAASAVGSLRRVRLFTPAPVPVRCDQELIRRVIINLLGNALKFTPAEGQITVTVTQENAQARFTVTDQGPGIPPEFHQKIFEKFAQLDGAKKKLGSGLGLAFCKLAVDTHQGCIGVQSQVGHGSSFWFTLPAANDPTSP